MNDTLRYFQLPEEEPIDDFLRKRLDKLPKDMSPHLKRKLLEDAKFFVEHEIPLEADDLPGISVMESSAYPNYDYQMHRDPPADTRKWLEAVRSLYYLVHKGESRGQAMQRVVKGWSDKEKREFGYWLRFYEEGASGKYKAGEDLMASKVAQVQFFDGVNQPGYYLPQSKQPSFEEVKNPSSHPDMIEDEKRETIERHRNKVISRLDSAEKLLRSYEGHLLAGKEMDALLDSIYQLKKKIHTVNKRSVSTRLYEGMIVREANVLASRGFDESAKLLRKVAQSIPNPPEANNPLQMGGVPGNWPGEGPGMARLPNATDNDSEAPTDPSGQVGRATEVGSPTALPMDPPAAGQTQSSPPQPSVGMSEFLKSLEEGNNAFEVEEEPDDLVSGASLVLGLQYQAALVFEALLTNDLIKEGQAAPIPEQIEVAEAPPADQQVPEAAPETVQEDPAAVSGKDFDDVIDSAFQQLTVADVVHKLEALTKVFQVREIPRQLSIIDMMLDRLGLASYFPTLGECVGKAHENNNYIGSRLDDILARLRGSITKHDIDLGGTEPTPVPGAEQAAVALQQESDAEKNRKKMRKDLANKDLERVSKPTPTLEVAEDLAQPMAPAATPATPATPPPAPAPAAGV
jgi:hypothetical protein